MAILLLTDTGGGGHRKLLCSKDGFRNISFPAVTLRFVVWNKG